LKTTRKVCANENFLILGRPGTRKGKRGKRESRRQRWALAPGRVPRTRGPSSRPSASKEGKGFKNGKGPLLDPKPIPSPVGLDAFRTRKKKEGRNALCDQLFAFRKIGKSRDRAFKKGGGSGFGGKTPRWRGRRRREVFDGRKKRGKCHEFTPKSPPNKRKKRPVPPKRKGSPASLDKEGERRTISLNNKGDCLAPWKKGLGG